MNSRLSHHRVVSLRVPIHEWASLRMKQNWIIQQTLSSEGDWEARRENLHHEGVREPQTHSSSRAYAGATRAASGRVGPTPERASDFNAPDSHGEPKSPSRTLTQQSIETCLLVEERGDDMTRVSRVVYKRRECSIASWTKVVSDSFAARPKFLLFIFHTTARLAFHLFASLNNRA